MAKPIEMNPPFPFFDRSEMNYPFPRDPPIEHFIAVAKRTAKKDLSNIHRNLLELALDQGVGLVHIYDADYPKGGLTIAFKKCSKFSSGTMVDVAVNVCSREDAFSKRIGADGALSKFFTGETISLPLLALYDESDLNWVVKSAFTALYDQM